MKISEDAKGLIVYAELLALLIHGIDALIECKWLR